MSALSSPAHALYWHCPGQVLFLLIPALACAVFLYVVLKRLGPLAQARTDPRFDRTWERAWYLLKYWLLQKKHPRYALAGLLHITIFAGFLILSVQSISLVIAGIYDGFSLANLLGRATHFYETVKDYAVTLVFVAVIAAALRRVVFKPKRYAPAKGDTRNHTAEAVIVLAMIALLMVSESVFGACGRLLGAEHAGFLPPLTLVILFTHLLGTLPTSVLAEVRLQAYLAHELTFFAFLCYLPFGKHFHVFTSAFNIYLTKLDRGTVKPIRWKMTEEEIDQLPEIGVRRLQDFTWKHLLDFYSCADCGRCSDNCPANASGRPLSPRFLTIKARDYAFKAFPLYGAETHAAPLMQSIYSADEIWSCTTCGACEEECPTQIEYIDKIVDLRRALVEDGQVPSTLQKPLKFLESRGNPYGKLEKKRAEWAKPKNGQPALPLKILDSRSRADTLFFVDSVSSYDDNIQRISRATARILSTSGEDFGILGPAEKDSGHEVRRFGEESLFVALRDHNREAICASGAQRIVTADPHAYNALRHDYGDIPPVEHISQFIERALKSGDLSLKPMGSTNEVYAYHDPCYLGRHNQVYDAPRNVLDAIPGLKRVEMSRCRDRSFCCGGGGLMLFYEAQENQRMGVLRVQMAAEVGATVIVTACPFCMVNMEDAIKVAGLEGRMSVLDLTEVVERQIAIPETCAPATELSQALCATN